MWSSNDMAIMGKNTDLILVATLLLTLGVPGLNSQSIPSDASCPAQPPSCSLVCPFGFRWDSLRRNCICGCAADPCQNSGCPSGTVCVRKSAQDRFWAACEDASSSTLRLQASKPGSCPVLRQDLCVNECRRDSDCLAERKCCSNKCGNMCVTPVGNVLGNRGNSRGGDRSAIGSCPSPSLVRQRSCTSTCSSDVDCPKVQRCCSNGCATVCEFPDKSTTCIHLKAAADIMQGRSLTNGYVPQCESTSGNFALVQCDRSHCWCVDTLTGVEVTGTKVATGGRPQCHAPNRCFTVSCQNKCPFGFETNEAGCPLSTCQCRNLCEGVGCDNGFESCQLVEPNCRTTPCQPVPTCLVNPCPRGSPMALPANGVTALCRETSQCTLTHWCHNVGYSGLGFCCPTPGVSTRAGECPSVAAGSSRLCNAECKTDPDCAAGRKCCYNGCGFQCTAVRGAGALSTIGSPSIQPGGSTGIGTVVVDTKLGRCPLITPTLQRSGVCVSECRADSECTSVKKCCSDGCSTRCLYPDVAPACIGAFVTSEAVRRTPPLRCDSNGNFASIQCGSIPNIGQICRCVDRKTGIEIEGTRVVAGQTPNCQIPIRTCPSIGCPLLCPFGLKLNRQGCSICECVNPCDDVQCNSDQLCVPIDVGCRGQATCQPQPRCLPNSCPNGSPLVDSKSKQINFCDGSRPCPNSHWCHNIGLNGRGVCCDLPAKPVRPGSCPAVLPLVDLTSSSCRRRCLTDQDCIEATLKCCFDGCGTACVLPTGGKVGVVTAGPSVGVSTGSSISARGSCPSVDPNARPRCSTAADQCSVDAQCRVPKKCCHDGCSRRCLNPHITTDCFHQLVAAEVLPNPIYMPKCQNDGQFEEIQCDTRRTVCWCVDRSGIEVTGTRLQAPRGTPNCRAPRFCQRPPNCAITKCAYGFLLDSNGCPSCACSDPCRTIRCRNAFQVCRMVEVRCVAGSGCSPVPKCVVNACPQGLPLIDPDRLTNRRCTTDNQCPRPSSYCHHWSNHDAYCCPQPAPVQQTKKNSCPALAPGEEGQCSRGCRLDSDCPLIQKCCFNGCGMSCRNSVVATTLQANKAGSCPPLLARRNSLCPSTKHDCTDDKECSGVQKCCTDGCRRRCIFPRNLSNCLHRRAAEELLRLQQAVSSSDRWMPICTADGKFNRVQRLNQIQWCVTADGTEIPGTRISGNGFLPDCSAPRNCPSQSCSLKCKHGRRISNDGCEKCSCNDLCEDVTCQHGQKCRLTPVTCSPQTASCGPIPRCMPELCPRGEPLSDKADGHLVVCRSASGCPSGHFCNNIGMDAVVGVCCSAPPPSRSPPFVCPIVPLLASAVVDDTLCAATAACKTVDDCRSSTEACCFNGCRLSCAKANAAATVVPTSTVEKIGVCPVNPISNPGCRSDCQGDSDCDGFKKCCSYGCGRLCQLPTSATMCIHWQAAAKDLSTDQNSHLWVPQCEKDGNFELIQCDSVHCWCSHHSTGDEIPGTRTRKGSTPNCASRRSCPETCRIQCPHGLLLDGNGCPLNNICKCRDPCAAVICRKDSEICVAKKVSCIKEPCSTVPACVRNPCGKSEPAKDVTSGLLLTCSQQFGNECGVQNECRLLTSISSNAGVCCSRGEVSSGGSVSKRGSCPSSAPSVLSGRGCIAECETDVDCDGPLKCCKFGCARGCVVPVNATNCLHYRGSTTLLKGRLSAKEAAGVFQPECDAVSGLFAAVQCTPADDQCYCVDANTGVEIYGTRQRVSTANRRLNCGQRRICQVVCDERSVRCPLGFETTADGCPTSACRCANPCSGIRCPAGETCLLRHDFCHRNSDTRFLSSCTPVPTCEKNPCTTGVPATEGRTYSLYTCGARKRCPQNYHCAGSRVATTDDGLCCVGSAPVTTGTSGTSFVGEACNHGDPLRSSSGQVRQCNTAPTDSCPTSYKCRTSGTAKLGICCLTAVYVCNQRKEPGLCRASISRYYYDAARGVCDQFTYGGCGGTENNFGSRQECDRFCSGVKKVHLNTTTNIAGGVFGTRSNDDPMQEIKMSFTLNGEQSVTTQNKQLLISELKSYLSGFGPKSYEIEDVVVLDNNDVSFRIVSSNARKHADAIKNAIDNNRFLFRYNGRNYSAKTARYESLQNEDGDDQKALLGLIVSCSIFALVVLVALCALIVFLANRNKKDGSPYRVANSSPTSNQYSNSGYTNGGGAHSAAADRPILDAHADNATYGQRRMPKKAFSTDDMESIRENGGYYSQARNIWHCASNETTNNSSSENDLSNNPRVDRQLYY